MEKEKSAVKIIREMNPGADIPTGAELAKRLREKYGTDKGEKND